MTYNDLILDLRKKHENSVSWGFHKLPPHTVWVSSSTAYYLLNEPAFVDLSKFKDVRAYDTKMIGKIYDMMVKIDDTIPHNTIVVEGLDKLVGFIKD